MLSCLIATSTCRVVVTSSRDPFINRREKSVSIEIRVEAILGDQQWHAPGSTKYIGFTADQVALIQLLQCSHVRGRTLAHRDIVHDLCASRPLLVRTRRTTLATFDLSETDGGQFVMYPCL